MFNLANGKTMTYIDVMSRLLKKMNDYVTVNGAAGKADLCKTTNRGTRAVERWLTGQIVPRLQTRYQIARQCGCTHEEALEIAQELPEAKRAG